MSLVNIMFRSNRTYCFSQNQTIYSVAFLITAWLVIVEGFGTAHLLPTKGKVPKSVREALAYEKYVLEISGNLYI